VRLLGVLAGRVVPEEQGLCRQHSCALQMPVSERIVQFHECGHRWTGRMCEGILGITTTDGEIVRCTWSNEQPKHWMFQTRRTGVGRGMHFWRRSWRTIATQTGPSFAI